MLDVIVSPFSILVDALVDLHQGGAAASQLSSGGEGVLAQPQEDVARPTADVPDVLCNYSTLQTLITTLELC